MNDNLMTTPDQIISALADVSNSLYVLKRDGKLDSRCYDSISEAIESAYSQLCWEVLLDK